MTEPKFSLADLLDKQGEAWRQALTITISVWRSDSGCYFTVEADGLSCVPNLEWSALNAEDLVHVIENDPLPASGVAAYPSNNRHWGEDQISGGLGPCTEIFISGGPWPQD